MQEFAKLMLLACMHLGSDMHLAQWRHVHFSMLITDGQ